MASIGIFGNLLVLSGQFFGGTRTHAEHLTYLRHLAASDLIMGIYLATIATADMSFRYIFIFNKNNNIKMFIKFNSFCNDVCSYYFSEEYTCNMMKHGDIVWRVAFVVSVFFLFHCFT